MYLYGTTAMMNDEIQDRSLRAARVVCNESPPIELRMVLLLRIVRYLDRYSVRSGGARSAVERSQECGRAEPRVRSGGARSAVETEKGPRSAVEPSRDNLYRI